MNLQSLINSFSPRNEQELHDLRMMNSYMNMFDDILLRSNEIAHFTASAWIVNPEHTKVLMAYHNIYQAWAWTGGHADGESDLLQVALREAREETGLMAVRPAAEDIFSLEILVVGAHFRRGRYVVPHLHLNATYLLEADESQEIRNKPDENSAVRWFFLDEAIEACNEPLMRPIYQKLNHRLLEQFTVDKI